MAGFSNKYGRVEVQYGEIPEGEPVFVIRGKDALACPAISAYRKRLEEALAAGQVQDTPGTRALLAQVEAAYSRFADWQEAHRSQVKDPDS